MKAGAVACVGSEVHGQQKSRPRPTAAGFPTLASFDQDPLAVVDLDHDPGAIVETIMIAGADVEHAIRAGGFLDVLESVAQRRAKCLGARLAFLERLGNGSLKEQVRIPGVAAKRRAASRAVLALVLGDVIRRRLLDRVAVRKLFVDKHRTGGKYRPIAVSADHAQE